MVYDITNPSTFINLDKWLDDVKKYADPNIVMILVGNKTDLEEARKINKLAAQEYAGSIFCNLFNKNLYFLKK